MDQLKKITISFAVVFLLNTIPLADDRHNVLIDVRTEEEFHTNHIPGAINVPLDVIHTRIEDIVNNTNENITLYCRSGRRSELARNITNGGSMAKVAERYSQRETDNNNH